MFPKKTIKSNEGGLWIWKRTLPIWKSSKVCASLSCCLTDSPTLSFSDSHESVLIMLQNAEQQVEDLKIQLDDALGAEEMLVQLTERNLMLSEVIMIHHSGIQL
jgi:hypothetical protein